MFLVGTNEPPLNNAGGSIVKPRSIMFVPNSCSRELSISINRSWVFVGYAGVNLTDNGFTYYSGVLGRVRAIVHRSGNITIVVGGHLEGEIELTICTRMV